MYKCYVIRINTTEFYVYVKDGTTLLYGGINSLKRPIVIPEELDRLANTNLIALTNNSIHIIHEKKTHLYGERNTNFDIKI